MCVRIGGGRCTTTWKRSIGLVLLHGRGQTAASMLDPFVAHVLDQMPGEEVQQQQQQQQQEQQEQSRQQASLWIVAIGAKDDSWYPERHNGPSKPHAGARAACGSIAKRADPRAVLPVFLPTTHYLSLLPLPTFNYAILIYDTIASFQ